MAYGVISVINGVMAQWRNEMAKMAYQYRNGNNVGNGIS
jgi:hypothetical protein